MEILKNRSIRSGIIITTTVITGVALAIALLSSFLNFNMTTTRLMRNSSEEINHQLILNYENYIDSVTQTANYISLSTNEYGLKGEYQALDNIYANAVDIQDDIVSIVLLDTYGRKIYASRPENVSSNVVRKAWFNKALENKEIFHFSTPKNQDIFNANGDERVITVSKNVSYYIDKQKYEGVLVIDLSMKNLDTLSYRTDLGKRGHIVILAADNTLVYSSTSECNSSNCESVELAKNYITGGNQVKYDGLNMYLSVNTLKNTRWRLASFINNEDVYTTRNNAQLLSIAVLFVTFAITSIVATVLSKRITDPISKLRTHISSIDSDNYHKVELDGQKEVVELAENFNSMIDETLVLMDQLITEQKAKRRSEFKALTTQINPHFLYNTLDSIMYLSENGENEKVTMMVAALSKFFRISISRGKNVITLEEELEHAKNYLLIQQIRYNQKFKFEFDVSEETKKFRVVKLILQPIIENAIYHGVSSDIDDGFITIRTYIKDEKLLLEVEDNGYGISDKKIEELYKSIKTDKMFSSVGLRNVYQRLRIYFNDQADLEIESELDEKTIFRLVLPIERSK